MGTLENQTNGVGADSTDSSPSACSNLDGYRAAEKAVKDMLDDAKKKRPKRLKDGYQKCAGYREGYFDGILIAHCLHVLGQCPEQPENAEHIKRLLS